MRIGLDVNVKPWQITVQLMFKGKYYRLKLLETNPKAPFLSQTIIFRLQFSLWSQALSCLQGKRGMILTHEKKFLYKEKTWLEAAETKQIDICHFFLFAKPVKKSF